MAPVSFESADSQTLPVEKSTTNEMTTPQPTSQIGE